MFGFEKKNNSQSKLENSNNILAGSISNKENVNVLPETGSKQTGLENELKKTSLLQKIRHHSGSLVGPTLFGAAVGGVYAIGQTAYEKQQSELKTQSEKANAYLIRDEQVALENKSELINDNLVSDVALGNKKDEDTQFLIRMSALSNDVLKKCCTNREDSTVATNDKLDYEKQLNEMKSKLKPDEKAAAKEKILELISLIKVVKADLTEHVKSDDYLNKLATEMNISTKAAREHQKVRLQNINNLKYGFKHSSEIFIDTGGFYYAYYSSDDNKIILPYDIDLKNKEVKDYFCEATKHEFLHGITRSVIGMSENSKEVLKNAFKNKDADESHQDSIYYSDPQELIVRKQFFDKWMNDTNFKKYGEEFTTDHYKKLLELKEENELPQDISELIDHIKPEAFVNMINELAELEKNDNNKKDYYHADWDYGNQENKT